MPKLNDPPKECRQKVLGIVNRMLTRKPLRCCNGCGCVFGTAIFTKKAGRITKIWILPAFLYGNKIRFCKRYSKRE